MRVLIAVRSAAVLGVACLVIPLSALTAGAEPVPPPATVDAGSVESLVSDAFSDTERVTLSRNSHGVQVPRRSSGGLRVDTRRTFSRVEVGLPGRSTKAAVTDSGTAVYSDVAPDTSLVVQAVDVSVLPEVESAVRTLITIESNSAPDRFEFPLDLPRGAAPRIEPDGSVAVVDRRGLVIGAFATPWAVDASGRSLTTSFTIENRALVQHIDHRGAVYPVIADPFWFVPVILVGVRALAPIVVKAATKAAAKKAAAAAAKKAAKKAGTKVKSSGSMTKVRFYTAGGHKIKPGVRSSKGGFTSFAAFKKKYGTKKDYEWHHIVEQKHARGGYKFGDKSIHNKNNLVQVQKAVHQKCINSLMGQRNTIVGPVVLAGTYVPYGKTLRQAVDGLRSYSEIHKAGVRLLRHCGVQI